MLKLINNKICNIMKKFFSMIAFLTFSVTGFAQDVDNFEVGPYEVDYKGSGDYKFRLRKGVDLYEYFGLKKDTILIVESQPSLFKNGVQIGLNMETCLSNKSRHSNVYGISGSYKQSIGNSIYLNGGLSLGLAIATIGFQKYNLMEVGMPLSVELSKISKDKASLYAGIGVVPSYYSTLSTKYEPEIPGVEPGKYSGLYLAPQLDFGGYIPVSNQLVRVGFFLKYKINCSTKDYDLYYQLMGLTFFGANIGLVF